MARSSSCSATAHTSTTAFAGMSSTNRSSTQPTGSSSTRRMRDPPAAQAAEAGPDDRRGARDRHARAAFAAGLARASSPERLLDLDPAPVPHTSRARHAAQRATEQSCARRAREGRRPHTRISGLRAGDRTRRAGAGDLRLVRRRRARSRSAAEPLLSRWPWSIQSGGSRLDPPGMLRSSTRTLGLYPRTSRRAVTVWISHRGQPPHPRWPVSVGPPRSLMSS